MKRSAIGVTVAMIGGIALAPGCTPRDSSSAADAGSDAALATAAPAAAPGTESADDAIRPVYPIDNQPPLPLAQRYCDVVRGTAKKRRDECCPGFPSYAPLDECTRTLSSALRSGAVTIDGAALDACGAAMTRDTAGCDWVNGTSAPSEPACLGILRGTLEADALCRSSLECDEGLRCLGLGATKPGHCSQPLPARSTCGLAIDTLAAFTSQVDFDRHHPECLGACRVRQCQAPAALGGACKGSDECGAKAWCVAGKCAASLPSAGQACTDTCAHGARCLDGQCAAPKGTGESCASDAECAAACVHDDAGAHCAGQCPSFPRPKK